MHNAKFTKADLPSRARLFTSTVVAVAVAALLAVGVVLPAEYGADPTGIGRFTGLTEMGEIKQQLAREAEADHAPATGTDKRSSLFGTIVSQLLIGSAQAQALPGKSDKMSVTLKPNQGAEIKLVMKKGSKATYSWTAAGGPVNYDLHGDSSSEPKSSHSYKKGRSTDADKGVLEAKFDGSHGWFWRNRSSKDVTVTIEAQGDFSEMKRVL